MVNQVENLQQFKPLKYENTSVVLILRNRKFLSELRSSPKVWRINSKEEKIHETLVEDEEPASKPNENL